MAEFLDMGGYGAYIWSVYGLAAVIMIALFWHSVQKWRQNEATSWTLVSTFEESHKKKKCKMALELSKLSQFIWAANDHHEFNFRKY